MDEGQVTIAKIPDIYKLVNKRLGKTLSGG